MPHESCSAQHRPRKGKEDVTAQCLGARPLEVHSGFVLVQGQTALRKFAVAQFIIIEFVLLCLMNPAQHFKRALVSIPLAHHRSRSDAHRLPRPPSARPPPLRRGTQRLPPRNARRPTPTETERESACTHSAATPLLQPERKGRCNSSMSGGTTTRSTQRRD